MSCGNTLAMNRPTSTSMNAIMCSSKCGKGDGAGGGCSRPGIGPRPNREKTREEIRDYILNMLGAPAIDFLELDEQNIDFCINQALRIVEEYAPMEYFSYHSFLTSPGKSVYTLPPDVGYVREVYYKEQPNFTFSTDLGGNIPIEYFYNGGYTMDGGLVNLQQPVWGRAGEFMLFKSYERLFSKMSSNIGGWEWVGGYRTIKLYPVPCGVSKVHVHYIQKCKDWEEMTTAMAEGALSYAKEILGRIRSRIKNPPGPNGGIQNDGAELLAEAKEERAKWKEELITRFGDLLPIMMGG